MRKQSTRLVRPHKALLFLLFQCFSFVLLAQVRISGRVTSDGIQGIPNVSVQIQNTTFGTATDEQGAYSLTANLSPGTYQLVFTGVGFRSSAQAIQIGSATAYTSNAQLAEDALKMDEVVVI